MTDRNIKEGGYQPTKDPPRELPPSLLKPSPGGDGAPGGESPPPAGDGAPGDAGDDT